MVSYFIVEEANVATGLMTGIMANKATILLAAARSHNLAAATGGLGVLSADTHTPVVADTTVGAAQTRDITTRFGDGEEPNRQKPEVFVSIATPCCC